MSNPYRTRSAPPKIGKTIANKYAKPCHYCGQEVSEGAGIARFTPNGWVTEHKPKEWHGSPVSGRWIGGCPETVETP